LYRSFVIEERFGFNKLTWKLWLADLAKGAAAHRRHRRPAALCRALADGRHGPPLVALCLAALARHQPADALPLPDRHRAAVQQVHPARRRLAQAAHRGPAGALRLFFLGLFVMDGSKRSAHGNAYFTGFGRAKRIVFFDTLLEKLAPQEIEAVLAHELGHFRHKHVVKRIALMGADEPRLPLAARQLIDQPWFYEGLGVGAGSTAMGLMLFSMVLPVFLFPLAPLTSALSRRHEYEADAYAAQQTAAADLVAALVKLYRDNAATLTPDPLHSLFHDSHPPASQRIARLHHA
jgi:STE24 endopeptidase